MCVENQGALCAACRSSLSLLLGWESQPPPATIGFQEPNLAYATEKKLVNYNGGKHICSIARTGAGKGRGCIIPNLLHFQGQTIVFDPKGENYHVTARYRRELGQRVVRIDPFHVIDDDSDAFNPFDLFALSGSDVETDAQTLAAMLAVGHGFSKDPFWDTSATRLITGVIAHLAGTPGIPESDRTLAKVCDILQADDTIYALAVLLDTVGEQMPKTARREIAAFLQQAERETRPSILATALTYLKVFTSGRVAETLRTSTFDLNDVVAGKPLTIYLILPVERLD